MSLALRLRNSVLHRLQAVVDRYYRHDHPGTFGLGLASALSPIVRHFQPNDRWNLHVFIPDWLEALQHAPREPLPEPKRIFIFTAYRGSFSQQLVLATLLAWRGHGVTIGYLPILQSPIKEPRKDHASVADYLTRALGSVDSLSDGRISCVDLTAGMDDDFEVDEAWIERRAYYDTIVALRRESIDPADPEVAAEMDRWRRTGRLTQTAVGSYLRKHREDIDLCIIPNGSIYSSAHALRVAQSLGFPCNSLDKFSIRNSRLITHGGHVMNLKDLDLIWGRRAELGLNDEVFSARASGKAMEMINQRRAGVSKIWSTSVHDPGRFGKAPIREQLGVGPDEPLILIATNVPFDAGYDVLTTTFPSMSAWLGESLLHLLEQGTKRIVLRSHPDEMRWAPKEKVEDILEAAGIPTSKLIFIPGREKINTYEIMEEADCGVVFSTTVGLEMAMMGKPVLLGAPVYYGGKGFTVDAKDRDDYFAKLSKFGTDCSDFAPTGQQVRNARLYHFLLHFAGQWPYPYDKPSAIERTPPEALVAGDAIGPIVPTLDCLALTEGEWRKALPDFLGVSGDNHLARMLFSEAAQE